MTAEIDFLGFDDYDDDWTLDIDFDLGDFDLDIDTDGLEDMPQRYSRPRIYGGSTGCRVDYEHAMDFARDFEFSPGMRVFAFVSGNFIFGDFIEALVDQRKLSVRRIAVQTLSMSEENIDSLRNIQEMSPRLESMDILLSAYFYSHERGGLVPYLYERLDNGDVLQVAFASMHTKIVTIETVKGNKLVMHGSANMRSSRNVEQIAVEADDGLYDFIDERTRRIMEAYGTINKGVKRPRPLRGGALWRVAAEERAAEGRRR